jgi:dTDP-4-dehydrorhamnose reductase
VEGEGFMKIVIFGATGLLGKELLRRLEEDEVIPLSSRDVNVEDSKKVLDAIKQIEPDAVINCAAIANPDICEKQPKLAYGVNTIGARNIAVACQYTGCKDVYISTDHVFGGYNRCDNYYTEFDITSPLNVYGKSKVMGERFTRELSDKYFIVRTSILFGIHRDTLVTRSIKQAKRGETIIVPKDQIVSPTYIKDLSFMIRNLLEGEEYGVYHLTNRGECSRYELVKEALYIAGYKDANIVPVASDFSGKAKRPLNVVLRNYMLEIMDKPLSRDWHEALKEFIEEECIC